MIRNGVFYINECYFLKGMGDDGNLVNVFDIVEVDFLNLNIFGFLVIELVNFLICECV